MNMCNFHPLEAVGRGSETQLQVGENSHGLQLMRDYMTASLRTLLVGYGVDKSVSGKHIPECTNPSLLFRTTRLHNRSHSSLTENNNTGKWENP